MQRVSAVAIFCEDIREEKTNQDTIVGTLPDNLNAPPANAPVPAGTPMLSKLGIYVRLNLDPEQGPPKTLSVNLINTNGESVPLSGWGEDVIEKAFRESRDNDMPTVGLILKLVAAPFIISKSGKLMVIVTVDGSDYIAGCLNISIPSNANVFRPPS